MKAVEDDILHYKMAVHYYFSSLSPQKHDSQESGSLTVHPVRGFANTQIFAIEIRKTYVTIKYLLKQYEF